MTKSTYPLTKDEARLLVEAYFGDVEAIEAVRMFMVELADWSDTEDDVGALPDERRG